MNRHSIRFEDQTASGNHEFSGGQVAHGNAAALACAHGAGTSRLLRLAGERMMPPPLYTLAVRRL